MSQQGSSINLDISYELFKELAEDICLPIDDIDLSFSLRYELYLSKLTYLQNLYNQCFFNINSEKTKHLFSQEDLVVIQSAIDVTKEFLRQTIKDNLINSIGIASKRIFMLPDLDKILDVFERMSFDDKSYFTFKNEENMDVCLSYLKKMDQRNWTIWFSINESASKQTISAQHLKNSLKAFKVEESNFQKQLCNILLMQVAFADEFIRQIKELLGEESVQKSILYTQNFMDELSKKIGEVLQHKDPKVSEDEERKKIKENTKSKFKVIK